MDTLSSTGISDWLQTLTDFSKIPTEFVSITAMEMTTTNTTETPGVNVLELDCFCNYSALTCVRNGVLSLFIIFLGFLFLLRVYNIHRLGQRYYHQMLVYYLAIVECILVTVHWVYMHMIQVEATVQYLRLVQLLIICHFYLSRATRLLRWERSKIFLLFALGLFFAYFTCVVVITIVTASKQNITTLSSCFDIFWTLLSMAECVLVQMFLLCGVYITKRMNRVVTLESSRRSQIMDLWSIIIAFELASVASLVYDAVMLAHMNDAANCSEVYNYSEVFYSIVYIFLMIFTIFTPLLILLLVFHPIDRETAEDRPLLHRSVFRPAFFNSQSPERIHRIGRRVSYSYSSIQSPVRVSSNYRKVQSYPRLPIIQEEAVDYLDSV